MFKKRHSINLVILFLLTLINTNAAASLDESIEGIDGKQHKLSEYIGHGKWIVLNIWGTRCPPCREEVPELIRFHDAHKDKDSMVVSIAIDFPSFGFAKKQPVIDFTEANLIDFPVLLSDASITEKTGLGRLNSLPTTYLFEPSGKLVASQRGTITKDSLEYFIYRYSHKKRLLKYDDEKTTGSAKH